MFRALHLSDIHVHEGLAEAAPAGFLNKRLLGAANLALRRARHFRDARAKLAALATFAAERCVDLVVSTGDHTALGTEPELTAARRALEPLRAAARLGAIAIPGNHDVYLPDAVIDDRFARTFHDLIATDRPDLSTDGAWPLVRLPAAGVAFVAVNSARPNPEPWRSSGRIPDVQLDGLRTVLKDDALRGRFVFVLTHYAPRRPDDTPDTRWHGLENADALLHTCRSIEWGALIHGHIHWRYSLPRVGSRIPMFGAGSTTCEGREGYWLYEVEPERVRAFPGRIERSATGFRCSLNEAAVVELSR